jgi:hypothetical protein
VRVGRGGMLVITKIGGVLGMTIMGMTPREGWFGLRMRGGLFGRGMVRCVHDPRGVADSNPRLSEVCVQRAYTGVSVQRLYEGACAAGVQ